MADIRMADFNCREDEWFLENNLVSIAVTYLTG